MQHTQNQNQKRILCDRISRQQKTRLLDLMREHPDLGRNSIRGVENVDFFWAKFTRILNAIMGAKKKSGQWKRSWVDWKASVKKQFTALVAYDQGNWTREDPPKPIEFLDLQIVEFITNLPPECAEYDVFVLNDTIKGIHNSSRSMSPANPTQIQTNKRSAIFPYIETPVKQEDEGGEEDEDFRPLEPHIEYENEDETEFEINFLEEPSCSSSAYLNENDALPPLHPIGRPMVHNRTSRTDILLEQLLKEQRRTNHLLQKTLNMLIKNQKS